MKEKVFKAARDKQTVFAEEGPPGDGWPKPEDGGAIALLRQEHLPLELQAGILWVGRKTFLCVYISFRRLQRPGTPQT